jgi:hypothetical protein
VGPLIGGTVGILLYDLFIGDVLHARLKLSENVTGPIEETEPGDVAAETGIPGTRRPDESETGTKSTRDSRRT